MKRFFRRLGVVFIVLSVLLITSLVMGLFKLQLIEELALDFYNEIAATTADLPMKNSMGPYAWKFFYIVCGTASGVSVGFAVLFMVIGFSKKHTKEKINDAAKTLSEKEKKAKKALKKTTKKVKETEEAAQPVITVVAKRASASANRFKNLY